MFAVPLAASPRSDFVPSGPSRPRIGAHSLRALRHAATLTAFALLGGCALSPVYQRPEAPVANAYPTGDAYDPAAAVAMRSLAADIGWRDFFQDPILQVLIESALDNNRDIQIAALNVETARAAYRERRAELLPRVDGVATSTSQRTPSDLAAPRTPEITRAYQASGAVSAWELDLWGRVRSLNDQALAAYLAREETRLSVQLSLMAEVANAYLTLRADQAMLRLAEETVATQTRAFALTRQRAEAGEAGRIDMHQAEAALRGAEADRSAYQRQAARDRNALVLLLGRPITPELSASLDGADTLPDDLAMADLPPGLPSELLIRRPDIRAAEQALIAANANIGAARAAFFPAVSLTGSIGSASSDLDSLFSSGTRAWGFGPQITTPLFRGGALRASLDRAHLLKQIEVARYERAVQVAFREVADGLAGQGTFSDQIFSEMQRVDASQTTYDLAEQRFREGEDSYLAVLDAQRTLYGSQQALIRARLMRLSNHVDLYKALGGGWAEHSVTAARPVEPEA
ncbi:efflux transporter outer membrane subunit [Brevundimonas naejangsanensis]|uniref:Efflux transporter outer membrane subunit n=1 Tax=Brevundimonas naejangsanensis TaxID=588932 RepID=A0A494RLH2_9CAUL|nr:efflux transporter outer membrane subunit [Brevundimonas naejangsanensis]AYG95773.1 efflux transporter outer membrane subunit [Brevundimonas naejangsanensis]